MSAWDAVGAWYVDLMRRAGERKCADPEPERDDSGAQTCADCGGRFAGYPAGAKVPDRSRCRRCNAGPKVSAEVVPIRRAK